MPPGPARPASPPSSSTAITTSSRPTRSTSGIPALRAHHPRQPPLRPRRVGRERHDADRHRDHRAPSSPSRRLPDQREVLPRRRGGNRQPLAHPHRRAIPRSPAADAVLSADGRRESAEMPRDQCRRPRLSPSSRVTLRTASKDLGSGRFSSARARRAGQDHKLIATLHNKQGHIADRELRRRRGWAMTTPSTSRRPAFPFDKILWRASAGTEFRRARDPPCPKALTLRPDARRERHLEQLASDRRPRR